MRASIPGTDSIKIEFGDGQSDIISLSGSGSDTVKSGRMLEDLQAAFEVVTPIRDLPVDDPDRTVDPVAVHGEAMFWRGKDLVSRSLIVDEVFKDGGLWHVRFRNPNEGLQK